MDTRRQEMNSIVVNPTNKLKPKSHIIKGNHGTASSYCSCN